MDSVIRRLLVAAVVAALALALAAPATAGKGKASVHEPPYKKGNSGGDEWNYVNADPQTGQVMVLRAFPGISPVVGCEPEPAAGWATLTQNHNTTGRIRKVIVNLEGFLEPYAWAYAVVRDSRGDSIGVEKLQGPHAGAGKLVVDIFRQPKKNSKIEIEFGAQVGDSCPQLGGADVTFPSIKIS